jgi:hypothetical protein
MGRSISRLAIVALVAMGLGLAAAPTSASVMLKDANSTAWFDPSSADGLYSWVVDGTEHMYQQWFWYRVGPNDGEQSIDALTMDGSPLESDTNGDGDPDTLYTRYVGADFRIDLWYILAGGASGSGASDIGEIIRITNTSKTSALDFHFFQYADFDLNDDGSNDTVEITGGNTAHQSSPTVHVAETVVTPRPSHYEAGIFRDTLDSLIDGGPTTLSDDGGPKTGDATWAFEWDKVIDPGRTLLISKDKNIIPEPATMALMGIGFVVALVMRRRR